jgi:hypothetical protein
MFQAFRIIILFNSQNSSRRGSVPRYEDSLKVRPEKAPVLELDWLTPLLVD